MDKNQRQAKRITRAHWTKVYKSAESISRAYSNDGSIPLITIKEIIDKAKIGSKNVTVTAFVKEHNKTLDVLYTCCETMAKDLNGKMPILVFKSYIDTLKANL